MSDRRQLLIERWLPVEAISAESMRERGASSALPPLYFLHVWWARRPLTTSRAAILASALPAWGADWPGHLLEKLPTEQSYHAWFLRLCGILGDPAEARRLITYARMNGIRLPRSPYTHSRAFTISPSPESLSVLQDLLEYAWQRRDIATLDPYAGGGSIPFESLRYGLITHANELNPVAIVLLSATLEYPRRFGEELAEHIRKYGKALANIVGQRLGPFFPPCPGEVVRDYLWARRVRCPYTGKPIPLVPNWWLRKSEDPVCVRAIFEPGDVSARFEVVRGRGPCARVKPGDGTIRGGNAVSPWAQNQPVDGEYIKAEAKAGRMGAQLYAVVIDTESESRSFRAPTHEDDVAVEAAQAELARRWPEWQAKGLIPTEARYIGPSDRLENYGVTTFDRMFLPRPLLSMLTILDAFADVAAKVAEELPTETATAVRTYLALAVDKAADYSSIQCHWNAKRLVVANTFNLHDFRPRWNPVEFDASGFLVPWVIEQVADAYSGIARLSAPVRSPLAGMSGASSGHLTIHWGPASDFSALKAKSVEVICTDPPYYDNVIYSECADFFYVWLKRTLGDSFPELFGSELTGKDDETVANWARFESFGRKKKKDLARMDYERKMAAAFREMHRVLRDDGVLTVMFTHKEVEAWDTLATSLIGAGFAIHSSWPVHTESEHSQHQAKKNAAKSTILLTCRKRAPRADPLWWDDIKGTVRQTAREKAAEFEKQGIRGVDLYIATFGPTLAILSESWPVLTSEVDERTGDPKPLRPEVALDLAREEVVALRKQGLLLGRPVQFDPYTDWCLMAWDAFKAEQFPGDEARKLALALGLDLERQVIGEKRLVAKKGASVVLQQPAARRRRDMVDPDRRSFECWIDAAHTAMLLYQEDGARARQAFLRRTALLGDATFRACMQALLNAIPRTKEKGKFVRPEAEVLEAMRLAFFDDLVPPVEEEPRIEPEQLGIAAAAALYGGVGDLDEEGEEGEDGDEG